jgi:transcriptional regulator with GAF, ATPase, and Fis domain
LYLQQHRQQADLSLSPRPSPLAIERPQATIISFSDAERHAILKALETSGWRISGSGGAADLLGLKPTTLHAKMKRLGVRRPSAPSRPPTQNQAS